MKTEVILCKDCFYGKLHPQPNHQIWCGTNRRYVEPNNFCCWAADAKDPKFEQMLRH